MDLEQQFDVVIIGTGLAESILSAACSRIGKTVLHLDKNSFYGESWGSFSFEQLVEWLRFGRVSDALYFHSAEPNQQAEGAEQNVAEQDVAQQPDAQQSSSDQRAISWSDFYKTITNIEIISYLISEEENREQPESADKWWSTEEFKKLSRKFNIDLCPKVRPFFDSGRSHLEKTHHLVPNERLFFHSFCLPAVRWSSCWSARTSRDT